MKSLRKDGGQMKRSSHIIKGKGTICFPDKVTVKLDLDGIGFKKVCDTGKRICRKFRLEGYYILRSSRGNYHVVFNRPVTWHLNVRVMAAACYICKFKPSLMKWFIMQCIKRSSTLRLGKKKKRSIPKIVFRYGLEDKRLTVYTASARLAKEIDSAR